MIDVNVDAGPWRLWTGNPEIKSAVFVEGEIAKAYLMIETEVPERHSPTWRIWLNDFSLTKIFRPNLTVNAGSLEHALTIYDVTPVIKRGKNEVKVTYKGETPLTLNSVMTILLYRAEKFRTEYSLEAGELVIEPKETRREQCEGTCRALVKSSVNSRVFLDYDGKRELMSPDSVYDVEFSEGLTITNDAEKGYAKLVSVVKAKTLAPKLEVKVTRSGDKVSIAYEGEVTLDKAIVNVLKNGISVAYKTFQAVKPGDSLSIVASNLDQNASVRVVAVVAGYRKTFDFRI